MSNDERWYELLNQHEWIGGGIEPLEHWSVDDMLDLQELIENELAERDRKAQVEYYELQGGPTDDDEPDAIWYEDDIMKCGDPDCEECYPGEEE